MLFNHVTIILVYINVIQSCNYKTLNNNKLFSNFIPRVFLFNNTQKNKRNTGILTYNKNRTKQLKIKIGHFS